MKRLIISSLLGCMLIGQMQAGDIVTDASAMTFVKGAAIGLIPLAVRGAFVAVDCGLRGERSAEKLSTISKLAYFLPVTTLKDRIINNSYEESKSTTRPALRDAHANYMLKVSKDACPHVNKFENRRINWNRIAFFFSALFCGASTAKILGWQGMPSCINNLLGSEFVTRGIAAGSSASLGLLLANLKKPSTEPAK